MDRSERAIYHVGWNGGSFDCPNCGEKVKVPFGGHTWTCHESYGGCGWVFRPVKALKRVDDDE